MENTSNARPEHLYKINHPNRDERSLQIYCLDELIPEDHRARAIWKFVEKMDLSVCFNEILTLEGLAGRSATSPKIIFCLWIYSIMDGNISARKIEELCNYHSAYKWIAGGVSVNRTMLSDFRSKNPEKFNELLISCLSVMVKSGLLNDQDFAQDGTKVKANAGSNSFRREESLENLNNEMKKRIKALEEELINDPKKYDARVEAAKTRARRECSERVEEAIETLKDIKKKRLSKQKNREHL